MAKKRNAVRAGIFMIVSVALVIVVVIAISGAGRFTDTYDTYTVAFSLQDDVAGLRIGDDVRVGGLKVGSVRDIQIEQVHPPDHEATTAVLVFLDLPSKYPLARNAHVNVQKELTGTASINIDDLGTGAKAGTADYIVGRPDSLSTLERKLGDMAPQIQQIVANVNSATVKLNTDLDKFGQTADSATSTVGDLHAQLPRIVEHYHTVASSAVRALDSVHDLLGPSTEDFHGTVADLHHITSTLNDRLPDFMNTAHVILAKVDDAVTRTDDSLKDIQTIAANTRDITGTVKSVVTGNKSKFDEMISSLKDTSENLKYASTEIRHSPWRLLYQPKPEEMANLNTYDTMRQFAEGAESLQDAAGALRDALADKNADPADVKKLMDNLNDTFAKFQAVQAKLFDQVKP
jgi:ABC-type transporter Mla subunit MlaD